MEPTDIAVIGYHGRFPGADSVANLWDLLLGTSSARRTPDLEALRESCIPKSLLDSPDYVPATYTFDDADCFDARMFGYTPREAKAIDPQHRVLLECGWNALEHAGYATGAPLNAGVYAGCSLNTYILATGQAQQYVHDPVFTLMSSDKDFLATRLAFKLQLEGPAVTIQSACSTSLVAVHQACQALLARECDMALAGGSCVKVPLDAGYMYREGGMLSVDGECRPFDARAGGTVFGSGVALVVLKCLADALTDGDTVHAVIKGTAINNDGARKSSYTAPSVDGIADAIRQAINYSGVSAESISYVECHGTGTALGDPVEVQAMARAFSSFTNKESYCAIGSIKGHIGHLEAAAGITGLIKAISCLENRYLPATLHFSEPSAKLPLAGSPFYVQATAGQWNSDEPRTALVNSLGVGGTNAAVIVREAPRPFRRDTQREWHVLPVSGKSAVQRNALRAAIAAELPNDGPMLADAAFTLSVGRVPLPFRSALLHRAGSPTLYINGPDRGVGRPPPVVFVGIDDVAVQFWGRLGVHASVRIEACADEDSLRVLLDQIPSAIFLALVPSAAARSIEEMIQGNASYTIHCNYGKADDGPPLLLRQAASLWCAGVAVNLSELYSGEERSRVPMALTPFLRERHWWVDRP